MKKILLILALASFGAVNSYGVGIGLQGGGGVGASLLGRKDGTATMNVGGVSTTGIPVFVKNTAMVVPVETGITLGFGSLKKPFMFLGVNFQFLSSLQEFRVDDENGTTGLDKNDSLIGMSLGFGLSTTIDFRVLTVSPTEWFAFYMNAGLGGSFIKGKEPSGHYYDPADDYNSSNDHIPASRTARFMYGEVVGRLPIGVSFQLANDHLELFVEMVPKLGLSIANYKVETKSQDKTNPTQVNFTTGDTLGLALGFTAITGIRFWL